jgi:hypothetical protein
MSQQVYIACNVQEGMFSDEAVIEIADQFFIVPKSEVRNWNNGKGEVRAKLFVKGKEEWIVLPTNYSDSVPRRSDLMLVA